MIHIDLVKAVKELKSLNDISLVFIRSVCEPTAQRILTIFVFMLIRWYYAIAFY